ncbi:arginase family protein [Desulfofundulus sp.]|uniref:arginase family protein n=1 Tax=Desulfofundulus sp. TaxID=2282750 RepID=UPI003C7792C5
MRVGLLETDETFVWQPRLARRVECRLRLDMPGLRCMSSLETLAVVSERLKNFPANFVFMGSGAFHHLALPLIVRQAAKGPLNVLIFDRHLDYFSVSKGFVSCGSWIREVVKLPGVRRVVVIGIDEKTVSLPASLPPKVLVLTAQAWRSMFPRAGNNRSYWDAVLSAGNIYLSIDKDVFSTVATDWGAGELPVGEVLTFLRWCVARRRLVGVDVCGEFVPRGPWPTLEERKLIAHNERINLALYWFFQTSKPFVAPGVGRQRS